MQAFQACLNSEKYKADVERDAGEAEAQQIGVTPTFILARSTKGTLNGRTHYGRPTLCRFSISDR